MTKTGLALFACCLLAAATSQAGWFRAIQVTVEDAVKGKRDFSVRFHPAKTHVCERVEIECIYHQEFPWENVRGKKYIKIHEPVTFEYRRRGVKMVNDLDEYISFRAPYGLDALTRKYGPKVFNDDYPVTVDRLRVTGYAKGEEIWSYEVPVNRQLDAAALARQDAADEAK